MNDEDLTAQQEWMKNEKGSSSTARHGWVGCRERERERETVSKILSKE